MKGNRVERNMVIKHRELGIDAVERVPLSGQLEGYKGDVNILDLTAEVKARKNDTGFRQVKQWIGELPILFIVEDRHEPLVVCTWQLYKEFIKLYSEHKQNLENR